MPDTILDLHEFLSRERKTILRKAREEAEKAKWLQMASEASDESWGVFYDGFTGSLFASPDGPPPELIFTETGKTFLKLNFAITEVVRGYTIIHQAILETAAESAVEISPLALSQLALSLDVAIANIVKDFEKVQILAEQSHDTLQDRAETERLGFLAHELRNCLQTATITLQLVENGVLEVNSKTGSILSESLNRMSDLIDKALANVRMRLEPDPILQRVNVHQLLSQVEVTSQFTARQRALVLEVTSPRNLFVMVDRHLLISAVANLMQNAMKFSHEGGVIKLSAVEENGRILIQVEDECGGLPDENMFDLFTPGVKKAEDRSGLGLGLAISKQAVERNNGELRLEDLAGKGCRFTIDLPVAPDSESIVHENLPK